MWHPCLITTLYCKFPTASLGQVVCSCLLWIYSAVLFHCLPPRRISCNKSRLCAMMWLFFKYFFDQQNSGRQIYQRIAEALTLTVDSGDLISSSFSLMMAGETRSSFMFDDCKDLFDDFMIESWWWRWWRWWWWCRRRRRRRRQLWVDSND